MQFSVRAGGKTENGWRGDGHRIKLGDMNGREKLFEERITSDAALSRALSVLIAVEPRFEPAIETIGDIPLRYKPPTFETLAGIIVSQHVSEASAGAIFGRLCNRLDPFTANGLLDLPDQVLIDVGLTRAKQATLKTLAAEVAAGLDLAKVCALSFEEATARLVALKGIGPWTAEVFLLQSGGHADVFAAGDVALRQAIADLFELPTRPGVEEAGAIANDWAPVRAAAARVLWAHYHHVKTKGRS